MEHVTDWAALWRQIVERRLGGRGGTDASEGGQDPWLGRAQEFGEAARRRSRAPGSRQAFLLGSVEPGTTVLDIGAGTGAWATLIASKAARVTAIDVSPSMIAVLRENLARDAVSNVDVVEGRWPAVAVEPHDYSLCSHAMYGDPDLPSFVRRMIEATRRSCFLVLRVPRLDGPMAEAAIHLWGQPFDSPNFTIAYNVLLQMGLTPNVRMDAAHGLEPRTSASLDEALARMRRQFGLADGGGHDAWLRELLGRHLVERDGEYVWPREPGAAVIYWDVAGATR